MAAFFLDTFTVESDDDLNNHTPDTGTSWTKLWASDGLISLRVKQATDTLQPDSDQASDGYVYTADVSYPSANYYCSIKISAIAAAADDPIYVIVRLQDIDNFYALKIIDQNISLWKKVTDLWTQLGSTNNTDLNVNDVIKLSAFNSSIYAEVNNVVIISVTDTAISNAGKAAIGMGGSTELQTSTDDILTANRVDDFTCDLSVALSGGFSSQKALLGVGV